MVTHPSTLLIEDSPGELRTLSPRADSNRPRCRPLYRDEEAQDALQLAKQRYKLGLGTVGEVTQLEIAVTAAQTRLADAQYDYKIAGVTLVYSAGGRGQMEIDPTIRSAERDRLKAEVFGASNPAFETSDRGRPARRAAGYFFCLARASAMAIAIVPTGCGWRS
ncbi:MAG: TolC family protein [Nitrospirota bacterium]